MSMQTNVMMNAMTSIMPSGTMRNYSGGYTESDFGCEEEYLEYLEWGDD